MSLQLSVFLQYLIEVVKQVLQILYGYQRNVLLHHLWCLAPLSGHGIPGGGGFMTTEF